MRVGKVARTLTLDIPALCTETQSGSSFRGCPTVAMEAGAALLEGTAVLAGRAAAACCLPSVLVAVDLHCTRIRKVYSGQGRRHEGEAREM